MLPILFLAQMAGLAGVSLPRGFGVLQRPGATPASGVEIAAECGFQQVPGVPALLKTEQRIADSAAYPNSKSATWMHLGCVRAVLANTDATGRDGVLMPSGTSWGQGAVNALQKGLSTDSLNIHGLNALALVSMHERFVKYLPQTTTLMHRGLDRGVATSATLRGCTFGASAAKDTMLVRRCANTAIAAGFDSTWHLIALAQQAFAAKDTTDGQQFFYAAVGAAHDTMSKAEVSWHLQWFLSPPELQVWQKQATMEHVRDWVMSRDVADGEPVGSRLAEHFNRLAVVMNDFIITPPKIRAKASLSGPPAGWNHEGGTSVLRDYERWQNEFDDRGVVWMRFGKPEGRHIWKHIERIEKLSNSISDTTWTYIEGWLYHLDDVPLTLTFASEDFDGSTGATTLRRGVNDPRGITQGWDVGRYCSLLGKMNEECDRGDIAFATETDDNSVRPKNWLHVGAVFDRIWDPVTELPTVLASYVVPIKELVKSDSGGHHADIDVTVRQWDPTAVRWDESSFPRTLDLPPNLPGNLFAGVVALPSTRGTTVFGLVINQNKDHWGNFVTWPREFQRSIGVRMSDVVLGAPKQGVTWRKGTNVITLAPLGYFDKDRDQDLELFFQTLSDKLYEGTTVTISVYTSGNLSKPALEIEMKADIEPGLRAFSRQLNISRLDKGTYEMSVTVKTAAGGDLVRAHRQVVVK